LIANLNVPRTGQQVPAVLASAVFALPFAIPRAREKPRYNQHMTSLPPIDPDLVTIPGAGRRARR
jgi:hypothetical protein